MMVAWDLCCGGVALVDLGVKLRRDGPPIRVAVVSQVRLYREGLMLVLSGVRGIEVVGSAGNGPQAVDLIVALRPSVAIVDARMVARPGLLSSFRQACAVVRVLAFGVRDDPAEIIACAEAGVSGYVSDQADVAELATVLEAVERDELSCSPLVAGALLKRVTELAGTRAPRSSSPAGVLTSRETEVMALVEQGLMNKQIARRLGISLSTVKNHVHRILQKEAVMSRDDLTRGR
jgi:two-component system nitrate/nitrite response regulator NarL